MADQKGLELATTPSHHDSSKGSNRSRSQETQPNQKCPFLAQPQELRLEVYEYLLISPSHITWHGEYFNNDSNNNQPQRPQERTKKAFCNTENRSSSPQHNSYAIFLACHTTYTEAAAVFYRKNTFNFRPKVHGLPIAFRSHIFMACVRHLRIDLLSAHGERYINNRDDATSSHINEIVDLCPSLQTFEMHLPDICMQWEVPPSLWDKEKDLIPLWIGGALLWAPFFGIGWLVVVAIQVGSILWFSY
ncbi:hypothetical protein MMC28_005586 [Mycoblastus sanguinarius]|nr:hypothetical protein [Mycoblastus sanguinarius]